MFVVIRDAIPGVKFRKKLKGVLTQDEPTLDITGVELPETGLYYIMVIRPFRHFHDFDYCLSLDSDGEAGDSLVVAWPDDDSEENAPAASTEAKTAEVQSDDTDDEGSSVTGDSTPTEPAAVVPALTAIAPLSVAPAIAPASVSPEVKPEESPAVSLMNPEDEEGDSEEAKPVEETTVDETEEVKPEESPAASLMNPEGEEDDREEVDDDYSDEDDSADEDTSDVDEEEPMLKGAPPAI